MRIVKKIDEMGRLVIPSSIRETLGLQPNTEVVIELEENRVILYSGTKRCRLCGSYEGLVGFDSGCLCFSCIRKIQRI